MAKIHGQGLIWLDLSGASIYVRVNMIGYWPNEGYEFNASKALTEDCEFFVGLSLDDENQYDDTEQRIASWVQQIHAELADL